MLRNKTIIMGVSGGIAAYKSCEIVSSLKKLGAEVWVVMTKEAAQLVSPLTFRTLSTNPVITDLFSSDLSTILVPHISLTDRADIFVIAPATANIIGKLANGIADDPLTTMAMACPKLKLIAPAMNPNMWKSQVVEENVQKLKKMNFAFLGPEEGLLACGKEEIGRMAEPEEIVKEIVRHLGIKRDLEGKHFLVTAGGTREEIDPVRYIANRSSGKMGYAIARAARERGAGVTLISAPTDLPAPLDVQPIKVESCGGMLEAVMDYYNDAQAVIMAAAAADFRPKIKNQRSKIKNKEFINLKLEPTEDILATIARQKGRKQRTLVGFALETEDLIENAKKKLKQKDLDLVVANDPSTFDSDSIKFSIINRAGEVFDYPRQPKEQAAHEVLDKVIALF